MEKYVLVNSEGDICGPIGSYEFVKKSLIIGYKRVNNINNDSEVTSIWNYLLSLGYTIRKAEIKLLED